MDISAEVSQIATRKLTEKGITPPSSLMDYIGEVMQEILNFCNIRVVPEALKYVAANMTVDLFISSQPSDDGGSGEDVMVAGAIGEVASVSEGGTSVSFKTKRGGGAGGSILTAEERIAALILDYEKQLARFRRITFTP